MDKEEVTVAEEPDKVMSKLQELIKLSETLKKEMDVMKRQMSEMQRSVASVWQYRNSGSGGSQRERFPVIPTPGITRFKS